MSRRIPLSRRLMATAAFSAVALTLVGPGQSASATRVTRTAKASHVTACTPSDLAGSLYVTTVGSLSTALAGAAVLHNTSSTPCTLEGVPKVSTLNQEGQSIFLYQAPMVARHVHPVTLLPAHGSGKLPDAGISITWSDWNCAQGTFDLNIRFPGWQQSLSIPDGTPASPPGTCSSTHQTIFVGPVAPVAAPT